MGFGAMGRFGKIFGAAAATALLATSSAPALARPGNGWGGPGYGYGYGQRPRYGGWGHGRGHYGRRDHIDFGDVLLGAIIVGGIAAVASSASKKNSSDRPATSDRDRKAEDDAANLCADAAEREAAKRGGDERVEQISDVTRDGEGWRVEGRLEDRSRYQDGRPFVCGVRYGKVDFVQLGDRRS